MKDEIDWQIILLVILMAICLMAGLNLISPVTPLVGR